jgi:glutamine synthetase
MKAFKLEYIWLDGSLPHPQLRSKTKIIHHQFLKFSSLPVWNFDGSSTNQAQNWSSDCLLKPIKMVKDPFRDENSYLVLCEVLNKDFTPHPSNDRSKFDNQGDLWIGFEQEFFIYDELGKLPLGHNRPDLEKQGKYYCGIGPDRVAGREIVDLFLDFCLRSDLNITGINAEVGLGQWEYQVMGRGSQDACDQLILTRYILERIGEKFNVQINYHPKPLGDSDWNGSGLHTNFSNFIMREGGGKKLFDAIFKVFEKNHNDHIHVYGDDNHLRLTGKHETQSIDKFTWGEGDRGASIRIPKNTIDNSWRGYLEDRRPASNANPYLVVKQIQDSLLESVLLSKKNTE